MVQTLIGKDQCKSTHFFCSDKLFCQKVRGTAKAIPLSDVESVVISYGIETMQRYTMISEKKRILSPILLKLLNKTTSILILNSF